jgi:hypothetical protein
MAEATNAAADWNVIVTLPGATFREARQFLRRWGEVHRTSYFHLLTLIVEDVESFLPEVAKAIEEKPGTLNIFSHIIPAQRTFTFASVEEFEAKARDAAILWAPMLPARAFMFGCTGASPPSRDRAVFAPSPRLVMTSPNVVRTARFPSASAR